MSLPSTRVEEVSKCNRNWEEKSSETVEGLLVRTKNKKFHLIMYEEDHKCSLKEVTFTVKEKFAERRVEVIMMNDVQWSKQYGGTPVATGWTPEKVRDKMQDVMAEFKDARWTTDLTKKAQQLTFASLNVSPKS